MGTDIKTMTTGKPDRILIIKLGFSQSLMVQEGTLTLI